MPVVGTAGHVDHGKSTLIQRITGRDPDRWAEEKSRGLTIDLGFAWAELPDGTEVSFVDVPGHEKFLKNMLAGVEAIDVALFVVAADEGWMPQSEEHLAVLDLLDVDRGVVALTKVDAAEPDLVELVRAEVEEKLHGTSLARAPIVEVSAITGEGLEKLLESISTQIGAPSKELGRPRMWVDRSFPVSGAGTVVTGTLLDGALDVGIEVEIFPKGLQGRIRGIQSHEATLGRVGPRRRVALNLGGVDHADVERGDMVGLPGQWHLSDRFSASIRAARYIDAVEQRGAYQLHIGSSAHPVQISGLAAEVALMSLKGTELPMKAGDRFIIRDTGRKAVVAGGRVRDPSPGRNRRALRDAPRIDVDGDPDDIATALLDIRGHELLERLAAQSGGGRPRGGLIVGDSALQAEEAERLTAQLLSLVSDTHRASPLRPGIPLATAAEQLGVTTAIVEAIVEGSDRLSRIGPDVASSGHQTTLTAEQERQWAEAQEKLRVDLAVPAETDLGLDSEVLNLKLRQGDLVRFGPGLVYLPEQLKQIEEVLRSLGSGFTVADFRDAAGLSRKYAVPILEWADKEGLTVRRGDVRHIR